MPLSYNKKLLLITLYFGFTSAIAQVLLIREMLTVFRGNEFIIGIIFSAWFLGIYLGARFNAGAIKQILEMRIKISLFILPLILLLTIYEVHFIPILLPHTPGTFYSIGSEFALSIILVMPVSIFIGFFFPPIVTLSSPEDGTSAGGNIFSVESFGSFIGGLLFSFVLIDYLNPMAICSLLIFISLCLFVATWGKKSLLPLLVIPVILILASNKIETEIFKFIWNKTHAGALADYSRTRYQMIYMDSIENEVNVYGDGVFYYTLPDSFSSRAIFHLINGLRNSRNDRILVFGSGCGSLVNNLLKAGTAEIYYCEPDKKLFRMLKPYRDKYYPGLEKNPGLRVINADYKYFLSSTNEKFDFIICLPPAPSNAMLNRYYTGEIFALCRERLKDKGIFLTRMHGFSNYMGPELKKFNASIYKSLSTQFPVILKTSGEPVYMIGAKKSGIIPPDAESLIKKYKKNYPAISGMGIEKEIIENFKPDELRMLFEKTQIEYFDSQIIPLLPGTDENLDRAPRAYWQYLLFFAQQEGSLFYSLFKSRLLLPALSVIISLIVFFSAYKIFGAVQLRAAVFISSAGFTSISAVIIMITLYQNFYGVIYHRISLINSVFMLGLAAGSWYAVKKKLKFSWKIPFLLLPVFAGIVFFIQLRLEFLFWLIILLCSLISGAIFPSLFILLSNEDRHITASNLDAMDHFGALMGSLLTMIVLIPFAGITGAVIFNIIIVSATVIYAIIGRRFS